MAEVSTSFVPLSGNPAIDGLLDRSSWDVTGQKLTLTWSAYEYGGEWTAEELEDVRAAFQAWENVANIDFVEIPPHWSFWGATSDIAVVATGTNLRQFEGAIGLAFLPVQDGGAVDLIGLHFTESEYPHPSGDVFFDDPESRAFDPGSSDFATLLHEIGHALGLKHPHDAPRAFASLGLGAKDNSLWTVMSYDGVPGTSEWPVTPMLLDILAIQHIYGANSNYMSGDDVYYIWSTRLMAIWDAGGEDTIDGSQSEGHVVINLGDGTMSTTTDGDKVMIAYGVMIENASGSDGNDHLFGNTAANVLDGGDGNDHLQGGKGPDYLLGGSDDDSLFGGKGRDTLDGGSGNDSMKGGKGDDIFIFDGANYVGTMHGGKGVDTLTLETFAGANDVLDRAHLISSVEIIDISMAGPDALALDAGMISALPGEMNAFMEDGTMQLMVKGTTEDRVWLAHAADDVWTRATDQLIDSEYYAVYSNGESTLLIDADITLFL